MDLNKTGLMRFWQINKCVTDSIEIKDKKRKWSVFKSIQVRSVVCCS